MLMIKQIQLQCQLASQLSAFSSLNIPVARHGPTVTIKLMVMCQAMLSSYLSKSVNTVQTALYRNITIATAGQLQCKLYLINKFSQPNSCVHSYTHSQQLATNPHVRTILSFLHSMLQQTWSILYDQITGGVPGQHSKYVIHILNNYTCEKLASNTRVLST